jgi:hypothetical protein
VSRIHPLDPEDANAPAFEACDEVRDGRLAEVHGGQVKHHRFADKKPGRAGERRVYFFKPAHDRYEGAKHERNVRPAPKAHLLTYRFRPCHHDGRPAFLIE